MPVLWKEEIRPVSDIFDTTSNHLSPSTDPVDHHPLPPFLKAAGLQTVKVQCDRGPQPTGHYALTIQNCDLIK